MRPSKGAGGGLPQGLMPPVALLLGILATTGVGGVPTSVLASAKDSGNVANHDDGGGGGGVGSDSAPSIHQQSVTASVADSLDDRNQISVPQKRGVNPLLYNDLEYSGNSIPHGGQWDDEGLFDQGPLSAAALYPGHPLEGAARLRNYDLLASLLGPPPQPEQTFYDGPVTPAVSFPYGYGSSGIGYGLDRNKRMATFGHGKNQRQQSLSSRLKRSPGKLSAADALSLLAILDSRDPYPVAGPSGSLSDYFPSSSGSVANGPNDVLPYSPTNQDIPLSLALAQLLAERNNVGGGGGPLLSPYGGDLGIGNGNGGDVDDDGQWMNSWTEPGVDYLGFPLDVGAARMNGGYGIGKPSKIGFTPQKRFMVSKRKRSVGNSQHDHEDCKSDKKTCLLRKVAAPA